MSNRLARHFYDFGHFRLDAAERLLFHHGRMVRLTPKAFEILLILVQNSGHVLTKGELMKVVWPDSFVEEGNLARNISTLRKALSEGDEKHHYIETVPCRGYRFAANVRESWEEEAGEIGPQPAGPGAIRRAAISPLAVLPFKPLCAEECDFSLGLRIADALITKLSSLRKIIVRPTSAVRKYANLEQDPVATGSELKVEAVLEGSIQQSGKRIRVTVRLISVRNESPLWAAQFDTHFTDIFTVEDTISDQAVGELTELLTGEEKAIGAAPVSRK
jgi:DNA-binding winged helix-turn-helix (wHTH) protein